jgi:2-polyprenyl-6-methoxyphenol hydroxylase-like FAD-dependent oxidoreductase
LNRLLLDEAEKNGNIELIFNASCEKIDFKKVRVFLNLKNTI